MSKLYTDVKQLRERILASKNAMWEEAQSSPTKMMTYGALSILLDGILEKVNTILIENKEE